MVTRIPFLLSVTWSMRLTRPLFTLAGHAFSGRDLILLAGGLFLLARSTVEIHGNLEGDEHHPAQNAGKIRASLPGVGLHIPKGYVYFATAFAVIVEPPKMRMRRRAAPLHLRDPKAAA